MKKEQYIYSNDEDDDDYETDSDVEFECEDEFGDEVCNDMEKFELRSESILQIIQQGSVIALYSPANSLELFYLCKVIECGVASDNV